MTGHEKRTIKKKENIKNASIELFSARGIRKVSMNEIAEKAQVSKVSIYNYFKSKDDLIRYVVKSISSEIIEDSKKIIESELSFTEKIKKIIIHKNQGLTLLKGEYFNELLSLDNDLKDYYENEFKKDVIELMIQFIEQGKSSGYIDNNIKTSTVLSYIDIFQKGIESDKTNITSRDDFQDLIDLFFFGFLIKH